MKINPHIVIISSFNIMLCLIAPLMAIVFSFISGMPIPMNVENILKFVVPSVSYILLLLIIAISGKKIGFRSIIYSALTSLIIFIASVAILWYFLLEAAIGV